MEEEAHEEVEEEAPKDETEIQVDAYVEWRWAFPADAMPASWPLGCYGSSDLEVW